MFISLQKSQLNHIKPVFSDRESTLFRSVQSVTYTLFRHYSDILPQRLILFRCNGLVVAWNGVVHPTATGESVAVDFVEFRD